MTGWSICRSLAILLGLSALVFAQDFKISIFQVYFAPGEGFENTNFIYTETSAIIDLVAKKKATLVCIGEATIKEDAKRADLTHRLLIPDLKNPTLQGLKWGASADFDHITVIPPKGPIPVPRWEVQFTLSASLFPKQTDMLYLSEGAVAVKEADVVKFTTVSGGTINAISKRNPIQFVLPVDKSLVYMRMEVVE